LPACTETHAIPGFAEPFSSLSHLVGAGVFALLGLIWLGRAWGRPERAFAVGIFAFSCVLLLSMSGVYHLLAPDNAGRAVLRRLDHAAIFTLIAGTFTAAHVRYFRGLARWGMIVPVWAAVITAVTLKAVFFTSVPESLGLALYLGLGWLGVISGVMLWKRYGFGLVRPVLWGGLAYTFGALFEFLRWPVLIPGVIGPHEVFHVFVLAGMGFHWQALICNGVKSPSGRRPDREERRGFSL